MSATASDPPFLILVVTVGAIAVAGAVSGRTEFALAVILALLAARGASRVVRR